MAHATTGNHVLKLSERFRRVLFRAIIVKKIKPKQQTEVTSTKKKKSAIPVI